MGGGGLTLSLSSAGQSGPARPGPGDVTSWLSPSHQLGQQRAESTLTTLSSTDWARNRFYPSFLLYSSHHCFDRTSPVNRRISRTVQRLLDTNGDSDYQIKCGVKKTSSVCRSEQDAGPPTPTPRTAENHQNAVKYLHFLHFLPHSGSWRTGFRCACTR